MLSNGKIVHVQIFAKRLPHAMTSIAILSEGSSPHSARKSWQVWLCQTTVPHIPTLLHSAFSQIIDPSNIVLL